MPNVDLEDMKKLAFPRGVRQQYASLLWEDQEKYFKIMVLVGCIFFLMGAFM